MPQPSLVTIVTGTSGNLGRATVHLFRERGHCVAAVDRVAGTFALAREAPGAHLERVDEFVAADLTEQDAHANDGR